MSASLLSAVELAPRDPILGVTEAFVADTNPKKVNLGVGVYNDDTGKLPVLECVKRAEHAMADRSAPRGYLPIDGIPAYDREVQKLLFGADSEIATSGRAVTVQALGGTGGLKIGADFLRKFAPGAQVWISDPSWENHRALFEGAGFTVNQLRLLRRGDARPRLSRDDRGARAPAARRHRRAARVLPQPDRRRSGSGAVDAHHRDRPRAQPAAVSRYRVSGLRRRHRRGRRGRPPLRRHARARCSFRARSRSRSRCTASAWARCPSSPTDKDEATRVLSQVKRVVRANYSNPPTHGGEIVAQVLSTPELRALWEAELAMMRDRIKLMRAALVERLHERLPGSDFRYMLTQRGMFSYSGLTQAQVHRLRDEYSIYAVDTGRICVAALNSKNVDYVADAFAVVSR